MFSRSARPSQHICTVSTGSHIIHTVISFCTTVSEFKNLKNLPSSTKRGCTRWYGYKDISKCSQLVTDARRCVSFFLFFFFLCIRVFRFSFLFFLLYYSSETDDRSASFETFPIAASPPPPSPVSERRARAPLSVVRSIRSTAGRRLSVNVIGPILRPSRLRTFLYSLSRPSHIIPHRLHVRAGRRIFHLTPSRTRDTRYLTLRMS